MPIILAFQRLRLEYCYEFEFNLDYLVGSRLAWATEYDPVSKKGKVKIEDRGCGSVTECFPSMCEVMGSILHTDRDVSKKQPHCCR